MILDDLRDRDADVSNVADQFVQAGEPETGLFVRTLAGVAAQIAQYAAEVSGRQPEELLQDLAAVRHRWHAIDDWAATFGNLHGAVTRGLLIESDAARIVLDAQDVTAGTWQTLHLVVHELKEFRLTKGPHDNVVIISARSLRTEDQVALLLDDVTNDQPEADLSLDDVRRSSHFLVGSDITAYVGELPLSRAILQSPWYEGPVTETAGWAMAASLLPGTPEAELSWANHIERWIVEQLHSDAPDLGRLSRVGTLLERLYREGQGELKPDIFLAVCEGLGSRIRGCEIEDEDLARFLGPDVLAGVRDAVRPTVYQRGPGSTEET